MKEDKKAAEDFVRGAEKVQTRKPQEITVGGKVYKIQPLRKFARAKIDKLNREAWWCEQQAKKPITLKQSHRYSKRINTLHAKTAALHLLGWKALLPFVYSIKWRLLMLGYDDLTATINAAGQAGDEQVNFTLASWDITRLQLARSTSLIGQGLQDLMKRMENARAQAERDFKKKTDTPKKAGKK
jgi:hypothetical protein